jgi:DNA repair photolyase
MAFYANLPALVERELGGLQVCPPLSISNVTDPCQDVPELRHMVKDLLRVLVRWGVSYHIITKGDPSFLAEVEGFPGRGHFFLAVTIEGPEEVLGLLSPRAPSYRDRLQALRWASSLGLPALVRLDPVIPPLWRALYGEEWRENAAEVLEHCAAAGAGHVVSSTGRFTPSTLFRLRDVVGGLSAGDKDGFAMEYSYDRSYTSSGYMLDHGRRLDFHRAMREAAGKSGMTYAVCQELGAGEADSPGLPHCEAFAMPFSARVGPQEFEPIPDCTANCHATCPDTSEPPCHRPQLLRSEPYRPSMLR